MCSLNLLLWQETPILLLAKVGSTQFKPCELSTREQKGNYIAVIRYREKQCFVGKKHDEYYSHTWE